MPHYGMVAANAVKWFLSREPQFRKDIQRFILNGTPDSLLVAGPPSGADILARIENPKHVLTLPTALLRFRMVRHHLTGELAVEITTSDDDLDKIIDWQRSALLRRAFGNGRAA